MQASDDMDGRYYRTGLDIPPEVQVETIEILNQTLASTIDLWMQLKCAHWNVKGMQFFTLYKLFKSLSEEFDRFTDLIGERIVIIGGNAIGTVQVAATQSQIPPCPQDISTGEEYLLVLSEHMTIYANKVRNCIELTEGLGEIDAAAIYTEISRDADKCLWMLEAHLNTDPEL